MMKQGDQFVLTGKPIFRVIDTSGKIRRVVKVKNIIVAGMKDNVVEAFNSGAGVNPVANFRYIALGEGGTPETNSDTELDEEFDAADFGMDGGVNVYATRIDGVQAQDLVADTYTVTGDITNHSGDTLSVRESGLFNVDALGGGELGSRATFATISLDPDESLDIEWVWSVSSG